MFRTTLLAALVTSCVAHPAASLDREEMTWKPKVSTRLHRTKEALPAAHPDADMPAGHRSSPDKYAKNKIHKKQLVAASPCVADPKPSYARPIYLLATVKDHVLQSNFQYGFDGTPIGKLSQLIDDTKQLLVGPERVLSISHDEVEARSREWVGTIATWYWGLPDHELHIGWPDDPVSFQQGKAEQVVDWVRWANGMNLKSLAKDGKSVMLDVGTGDGSFVKALSLHLGIRAWGVDVEGGADTYKHEDAPDAAGPTGSAPVELPIIGYDGVHLEDAVMESEGLGQQLRDGTAEIALVTYVFSLHHFGSLDNQYESLRQAYWLMRPGGLLIVKEHDVNSLTKNRELILQHWMKHFRYRWINQRKDCKCATYECSRDERLACLNLEEEYKESSDFLDNTMAKNTFFTSMEVLRNTAVAIGFLHVETIMHGGMDVANKYAMVLQKPLQTPVGVKAS